MYPREYFDTFWRGDLRSEIFVAMPFSEEFQPVWERAIRPAVEEDLKALGLMAHRVDTTIVSGSVVTEIMDGIAHARLVLADISVCAEGPWRGQRNGNVMYEVGLTHAIRQACENLLIRCDLEKISFDVAGIRVHNYRRTDLEAARSMLSGLLRSSLLEIDQRKSLKVQQVVDALDADAVKLMLNMEGGEYFALSPPKTVNDVLARIADGSREAVRRLLSLGVFRFDFSNTRGQYAYHWTAFGRAVLKRLRSQE